MARSDLRSPPGNCRLSRVLLSARIFRESKSVRACVRACRSALARGYDSPSLSLPLSPSLSLYFSPRPRRGTQARYTHRYVSPRTVIT